MVVAVAVLVVTTAAVAALGAAATAAQREVEPTRRAAVDLVRELARARLALAEDTSALVRGLDHRPPAGPA